MSKQHTMIEIAQDFNLWGEYVDTEATMTKAEFDALSTDEKIEMQRKMFPYEAAQEDDEATA